MIDDPMSIFDCDVQLAENVDIHNSAVSLEAFCVFHFLMLSLQDWEYQMRREMQEILPGLYLGPYASAMKNQLQNLKKAGITHIVCVRQDCESRWIRTNLPDDFTYITISIADSPTTNIIPFFAQFANFIDQTLSSGGKVLVHGNGGISRSATLVISYVMKKRLYSAFNAIRFVQSKRFCVFPNEGFRRQLFEYEPILRASLSASGILPITDSGSKRNFNDVDQDESPEDNCRQTPSLHPSQDEDNIAEV